jgi:hypothetical protein
MSSIQRDPRKQYVLNKRNCKDLSITQKLYHPECRKEATFETPINPRPSPPPSSAKIPDLPDVPKAGYTFQTPSNFNFSPNNRVNPALITFGAIAGVGALGVTGRMLRASDVQGRYARVPTSEPDIETGEARTSTSGNARTSSDARGNYERVPTEEGEGVEMESRAITPRSTVSSQGLRQRINAPERLNYGTTEEDFAQYRDVPLEEPTEPTELVQTRIFPRANPPTQAPTDTGVQASEAELNEAEASRTQLTSDLDDLISQAKAQQASVNQAEEQITQVEGEDTTTTEA